LKCDNCGRNASGKFCSNCGASLGSSACPTCGHTPPAGARFCNQCGGTISTAPQASTGQTQASTGQLQANAGQPSANARVSGRPSPAGGGQNNSLWVVGGVVLAGVMLVALYPIFSPTSKNLAPPQQAAPASSVDLTTMTPREAADRLWNRVMQAVSDGDTQEVVNFLPMAIGAYEVAEPLDLDGKYHLSALKLEGLDNEGALGVAEAALEIYSDHLLNLAAAAEAALALGDSTLGRSYYQRMLDVWDAELATERDDYESHKNMQPILLRSAEALLGG
jgi:Double zinc ribbon